jgi:hypothetical protein
VGLIDKGYSLPYLDGLIVGFDGLSRSRGSRNWFADGDETTEALEFAAGMSDGRHARRLLAPL